jgi:hypothetical protein
MIAISIYKFLHILGIMMIFASLGGMIHYVINGGTKTQNRWQKAAAATHGLGMVLVLLGGFGMLARLGIHWPWPGWVIGKIIIWIILGGIIALIYRLPNANKALWYIVLLLGAFAAYLAIMKPF